MTAQSDGGGVLISLETIYRQLLRLTERVDVALAAYARTEQMVAEHDAELRPLAGAADRLTDHEARLRQLERSRWPVTSVTMLVGVAGVAVAIIAVIYGH